MPHGVLCRVVQEFCRCFTPLVKQSNLLDLEMLDMPKKDSMAPPVPTEGTLSSEPRAEEPIGLLVLDELTPLEPKEAAHSKELALVQRRPLALPGFTLSWTDKSDTSP